MAITSFRILLAFLCTCPVACFAQAATPAGPQAAKASKSEPNAALYYWLAFSLAQDELRSAFDDKTIDHDAFWDARYSSEPVGKDVRQVLENLEPAFGYFLAAVDTQSCDWQLLPDSETADYEIFGCLIIGDRSRLLANLAVFRLRVQAEDGESEAAMDTGLAIIQMGRNVTKMSSDPAISHSGLTIEEMGMHAIATSVCGRGKIDAATLKKFQSLCQPVERENTAERGRVKRAQFEAGLQIIIHGEQAVGNVKDPLTNQPFQYRKTGDGFHLLGSNDLMMTFVTDNDE